ncbi:hypothetical protein [Azotosporobacter soli]|uniref:hypothetical protein n=1 Tax=Azotosporobacter soli TaxID=3055040 RepID=UPI0031FE800C
MEGANLSLQERVMLFFAMYIFGLSPALHILGKVGVMPSIPQSLFCIIPIVIICIKAHGMFIRSEVPFLLLYGYIFFYSMLGYSELELSVNTFSAIRYTFFGSVYPFILFLFFRQPQLWQIICANKKNIARLWAFLTVLYVALSIYGMSLVGESGGVLSLSLRHLVKFLRDSGEAEFDVGYQAIGDSYVCLTLLLLCLYRSLLVRVMIFGVAVYILYIVGSRASLLFFVAAIMLVKIARMKFSKNEIIMATILMTMVCGIFSANLIAKTDVLDLEANPMVKLMVGVVIEPEKDESYVARQSLAKRNTDALIRSDFLGAYRFEIKEGRAGNYTHSVISILEEYGAIGFAALLIAYAAGLLQAIRQARSNEVLAKYALYMMVFWGMNMFLARAYDNIIYWFAIVMGIVSAAGIIRSETGEQEL